MTIAKRNWIKPMNISISFELPSRKLDCKVCLVSFFPFLMDQIMLRTAFYESNISRL